MSTHIGAKPGDIAETVLLPGDPYRAKWAAETFLKNPVCVNEVRGMLGYTGEYNGERVTIHGSGMGMPSLSIYVNELIADFGAKTLIRIGSCGGMAPQLKLRDVIIAMTASNHSGMNRTVFPEIDFAPCADWQLLKAAAEAAAKRDVVTHIGSILSGDTFYHYGATATDALIDHGVLAVEMETAALYTLAARFKVRALSVLTVSDHIITEEALPAADRERSFSEMVEIALQTAFG